MAEFELTPEEQNQVYYVDSSKFPLALNPMAIRPKIHEGFIEWEDTSHGTLVEFRSIKRESTPHGNKISIEAKRGGIVILMPVTLEIFNKNVKEIVAGSPVFQSDQELKEYYLNTDFYAY